ncbi:MAG: glycerol-3-phosphate dehydrogenase/oxidase [Pseudomonadota bacterium]|nr:glycerol-3-phosphate dehydrogenase/oxidase [Pseudomonadota bacterium]
MNREHSLRVAMTETAPWDVLVIGGGATGLGSAVDAASRGYRTLLVEQADFAKATSSRSTKLVHGGVRYLQQGNLSLVLEALKERGRMLHNAPHLVRRQSFVIPAYALWEVPFYGVGLKMYDALSGSSSFGRSRMLGKSTVRSLLPTIVEHDLAGGVEYFDGQFDDARYALALAQTLDSLGGTALNYTRMVRLLKSNGKLIGAVLRDEETGHEFEVQARAILNATGIFTDEVRQLDDPGAAPILSVSQGSHFVLPKDFLPGANALMVPKTKDGRVLFAIPWHNHVVVGTTDDGVPASSLEPRAMQIERDFLREHIEFYFGRKLKDSDILSVWSGQRPLVRKQGASSTAALSREHTVLLSPSGLVSITGGKWTTYRRMAEDAIDIVAKRTALPRSPCRTATLHLHGWIEEPNDTSHALVPYGSDLPAIDALAGSSPKLAASLHPRLPYRLAEVVWAARYEMARSVEDVLARRMRCLFLDARAALEAAPAVAACLASELGRDLAWQQSQVAAFRTIASTYIYTS